MMRRPAVPPVPERDYKRSDADSDTFSDSFTDEESFEDEAFNKNLPYDHDPMDSCEYNDPDEHVSCAYLVPVEPRDSRFNEETDQRSVPPRLPPRNPRSLDVQKIIGIDRQRPPNKIDMNRKVPLNSPMSQDHSIQEEFYEPVGSAEEEPSKNVMVTRARMPLPNEMNNLLCQKVVSYNKKVEIPKADIPRVFNPPDEPENPIKNIPLQNPKSTSVGSTNIDQPKSEVNNNVKVPHKRSTPHAEHTDQVVMDLKSKFESLQTTSKPVVKPKPLIKPKPTKNQMNIPKNTEKSPRHDSSKQQSNYITGKTNEIDNLNRSKVENVLKKQIIMNHSETVNTEESIILPKAGKLTSQLSTTSINSKSSTNSISSHDDDNLYAYEWYFGGVERKVAEDLLHANPSDGLFLIRKSKRGVDKPYTLAVYYKSSVWNVSIRLRPDNNRFALGTVKEDEKTYSNIPELVSFHRTSPILLQAHSSSSKSGGETVLVSSPRKMR